MMQSSDTMEKERIIGELKKWCEEEKIEPHKLEALRKLLEIIQMQEDELSIQEWEIVLFTNSKNSKPHIHDLTLQRIQNYSSLETMLYYPKVLLHFFTVVYAMYTVSTTIEFCYKLYQYKDWIRLLLEVFN